MIIAETSSTVQSHSYPIAYKKYDISCDFVRCFNHTPIPEHIKRMIIAEASFIVAIILLVSEADPITILVDALAAISVAVLDISLPEIGDHTKPEIFDN